MDSFEKTEATYNNFMRTLKCSEFKFFVVCNHNPGEIFLISLLKKNLWLIEEFEVIVEVETFRGREI